jgi:hypothetical protein
MKKKVAEAWVKDLRKSPHQTDGTLKDERGYCCLGRLCLILGAKFKKDENGKYYPYLNGELLRENTVLPEEIRLLAGMKTNDGHQDSNCEAPSLTKLNDDEGLGFSKIADFIEKNWRKL